MSALQAILSTGAGYGECHARADDEWMTIWLGESERRFDAASRLDDSTVSLVPRQSANPKDVAVFAGCLWARLETGKHAEALSRLRLGPSLVVREGRTPRRWALWWLQEPLRVDLVARGNRALAYTLGTVQKYGSEPESAFMPCPGTHLTSKGRALPVTVEYAAVDRRYRPSDFRGVVRKPPEKSTEWRKAA